MLYVPKQKPTGNKMKLLHFLCVLCLLKCPINCTQDLYKFVPDHCEVANVNESLIRIHVAKCYKLSRSELYFNISCSPKESRILNDQMGQVLITGYQFRSNEYRKGPVEFVMGMWQFLSSKDFDIPHMISNSNMRCPLIKGRHYYTYNLSPNATNMPPLIPEGKWMLQVDFMYMNKYIVEYPIIRFEQ